MWFVLQNMKVKAFRITFLSKLPQIRLMFCQHFKTFAVFDKDAFEPEINKDVLCVINDKSVCANI